MTDESKGDRPERRTAVVALALAVGCALRVGLLALGASPLLASMLEVTSPVTCPVRLREASFLLQVGRSAYDGPLVLAPPLAVWLLAPLLAFGDTPYVAVLIAADLLVALCLQRISHRVLGDSGLPVGAVWILNPLSIAPTLAGSYQVLNLLPVVAAVDAAIARSPWRAAVFVAVATYMTPLSPLLLVFPLALVSAGDKAQRWATPKRKLPVCSLRLWSAVVAFGARVALAGAALLGLSFLQEESWAFLRNAFLFQLDVQDMTPNVGYYWYAFAEVFDRFRMWYLTVCHGHPILYIFPMFLAIGRHLPNGPMHLVVLTVSLISLVKPYPVTSDFALLTSFLLLQFEHMQMKQRRVVAWLTLAVFCLILLPFMKHSWLDRNQANPNYYFACSFLYNIAAALLVLEWLKGGIMLRKRERMTGHMEEMMREIIDSIPEQATGG